MNNKIMKKGDIWISAIIYIGLGVVAITLLVGAGVPIINKMKDRSTFFQTKEVMQTIDKAIIEVVSEGPGSRRYLSPLEIKKGSLAITLSPRRIVWEMETKALLQEPGQSINEGNLNITVKKHELIKDLYKTQIALDHFSSDKIYICVNKNCNGKIENLNGKFSLSITNEGVNNTALTNIIQHQVNIDVI